MQTTSDWHTLQRIRLGQNGIGLLGWNGRLGCAAVGLWLVIASLWGDAAVRLKVPTSVHGSYSPTAAQLRRQRRVRDSQVSHIVLTWRLRDHVRRGERKVRGLNSRVLLITESIRRSLNVGFRCLVFHYSPVTLKKKLKKCPGLGIKFFFPLGLKAQISLSMCLTFY